MARRTPFRVATLRLDRDRAPRARSALAGEGDIAVHRGTTRGYLDGDRVLVRLTTRPGGSGRRPRGAVVQLVERTKRLIRGVYQRRSKGGLVRVDQGETRAEIWIPAGRQDQAEDGERVLVRLTGDPRDPRLRGEVVTSLADEGAMEIDLAIILAEFELPGEHGEDACQAAEAFPSIEPGASWPGRRDLRDKDVFTIDPRDAEDFDDALSLERLEGGVLRIGVHIADVAHYVTPGSELDGVAARRGTSVYLPGHVIPMLPERLSNDLCSLRGLEDRLTITVDLTYGPDGQLLDTQIYRSVIHSRRRFDYEEVQAILDWIDQGGQPARLPTDHADHRALLVDLRRLCGELRRRRFERGALAFDIPKPKIRVTETGAVEHLGQERQDESHELIEEFMLAANEAVARFLVERRLPVVGRVHPAPEGDRWEDLLQIVRAAGFRLKGNSSSDFQQLVSDVEGSPLSTVVQIAMLRAMGHAEYRSGVGLHFALATDHYCHFTSPIRRYPDLLVHQILGEHLDGDLRQPGRLDFWQSRLPALAEKTSELERRAEAAERAMTQLRLIRYLEPRRGEEMEGVIHSVHVFGFFVHVPSLLLEGLVPVATLGDDFYEFNPQAFCLEARHGDRRFCLGDRLRVILWDLDPEEREISFRLAGDGEDE